MAKICYNCGIELNKQNSTVEHVPAKSLYEGFDDEFKKNLITVSACFDCNNLYSKIDQELRDAIAIKNDDPEQKKDLTGKGVRSILRRRNWKDRTHIDINGSVTAVDFKYADLKQIHIKNFKALFFYKYNIPVPDNFIIEIISEGDEDLMGIAQVFSTYIRKDRDWEISGHHSIFKFILKDMTQNKEANEIYESGDFDKLQAVTGLLGYHDEIFALVVAGKKEFLESQKKQ